MRVRDTATHQKIKISFKAKRHHSEYQSRPSALQGPFQLRLLQLHCPLGSEGR